MEDYFSPKGKEMGFWTPLDGGVKSSASEDMFNNISELMNFDTYAGWCNGPSTTFQNLANELSSFASLPYSPSDVLNLVEHSNNGPFFMTEVGENYNTMDSSSSYGEKVVLQQMDTQFGFLDGANSMNNNLDSKQKQNGSFQQLNASDMGNYMISKSPGWSLDERMLRALSLFKESAGGGILAQVWVPVKHGDEFILSTSEQPYLLDQKLAGYREVSRTFTFSAEEKGGSSLGVPGRVFISHVPEWTSHVGYYHKTEYSRLDHAISHEVCGSIALPVSDPLSEVPCSAVLEVVTTKEKPNFDRELEFVSHALQVGFSFATFSIYFNICRLPISLPLILNLSMICTSVLFCLRLSSLFVSSLNTWMSYYKVIIMEKIVLADKVSYLIHLIYMKLIFHRAIRQTEEIFILESSFL